MHYICHTNNKETMRKETITYGGTEYQAVALPAKKVDPKWEYWTEGHELVVADEKLWDAMRDDYDSDITDAIDNDNNIFCYCPIEILESSEDEIIKYVQDNMF